MVDLIACYWTIAGPVTFGENDESGWSFQARAEAAGKAGFRGIGLKHADLMKTISTYGVSGVRTILADNGLRHLEVEALSDWWCTGPVRAASDRMRYDLLEAAGALGARHLKAYGTVMPTSPADLPVMRDAFAVLAEQARMAGTIAVLEPIGCSDIPDLATALAIVGDAAGQGGGLMLDAWHVVRGGIDFAEIAALPAASIGCVEIDDGPAQSDGSYLVETMNHRQLCGEGEGAFDLPGLIRAVAATGYAGPWGVEIIAEAHRALPLSEAAARSFATADRVVRAVLS